MALQTQTKLEGVQPEQLQVGSKVLISFGAGPFRYATVILARPEDQKYALEVHIAYDNVIPLVQSLEQLRQRDCMVFPPSLPLQSSPPLSWWQRAWRRIFRLN